MFITALAPNTMAIAMITKAIGITIPWTLWFKGFLPVGVILLLIQPALLYAIYPPEIKEAPEAPRWAAGQLKSMGAMTRQEITMLVLVLGALGFWIGGAAYVDPAIVAGFVILGMVIFRVVLLGRDRRPLAGVEHADLVRDARDDGGRAGGDEVPRLAGGVARADAVGPRRLRDDRRRRAHVLLPALLLREHHRAHRDAVSALSRGRDQDSRRHAHGLGARCSPIRSA